ncbi:tRNA (guanine-N1-)-methyltransferase [Thiobacillus denitrificans ATCC 25259]|uniref:tRNA (guanine-N(1)-)-methyltransferase n=1 Tax=Thiobacillus denitrificans (strain ATCC 25259 / T1) TaxID=292415 RepID=TRMD_THIDA|nr:tRNA (guanosine(37)-N1)-methyltransferase TrmD [Thiobacillus denitrificans]Q3SGC2.1 RecName: Full=tRNA (guanine-N(1)-)-methyltransferase; AltName: Full=M1G-methyltransferase; AltName: Full=tRNA [GM37] methyltransferase [Thiobacillus denitrificans ATCC 25259]AAZ98328.1 tRNA (guanine-N1-)-methyltransferase [Thiobacillus denitrificans ATCC 25259]
MRFDAVTLFAEMFDAVLDYGITRRALDRGLYRFKSWNPRAFTDDPHRTVDDRPYGGGPGMLMLAEPLDRALNAVQQELASENLAPWVVHFSPRGRPLTQQRVMELKDMPALVLLCGRYEGIDERLLQRRVDEEVSLGDFVLSGGELPALALMDAIVRQLPGALNDAESAAQDSFSAGLLDCPHYTRPEVWQGMAVPQVLKSGNHAAIAKWRHEQSLRLTGALRPDLLERAQHDERN